MSKSRPITKIELDAIKQSVENARKKFRGEGGTGGDSPLWYASRSGFRYPVDDFSNTPKLAEWFRKCGDRLIFRREVTNLERFLLDHWAESKNGLPPLYSIKPAALFLLCRTRLNLSQLTEALLIKVRQRLGLKAFKRQKVEFQGGKWVPPQVDKR